MRLHFIRSPRALRAVLEELYAILDRRGHEVTESIPDTAVPGIAPNICDYLEEYARGATGPELTSQGTTVQTCGTSGSAVAGVPA
jgi:hypothetical protein